MTRSILDAITILDAKQVSRITGLSRATIYRNLGEMPPRYRVSERRVGWRKCDIEDWLEARVQRPTPEDALVHARQRGLL